jgi:Uma2 family endonuclease
MIAMASSIPRTVPATVPAGEYVPLADKRIVMRGIDWSGYQALLALRGENAGPRITYLDGNVDLMGASFDHEQIKCKIATAVAEFCYGRGIVVHSVGSWHLEDKTEDAGAEPDQCYVFGPDPRAKTRPDLAIEIVWTSGGLDKLEVYRRLGVPEVWYWREGKITVHVLGPAGFPSQAESACLPDLDMALVTRLVDSASTNEVIGEMRAALRLPP